MLKVNWINIQGFRSFGKELQNIQLNPKISVIWGANSQGKTSLSEAIEFLLTGQISRKNLLSSTQDEFADSLKNAFISDKTDIYIEAEIQNSESKVFKIKRALIQDYGKKNDCSSRLEINDVIATEDDIIKLGVPLFQQPMPTSILMQHALSYLFSARPQDRSSYFKALLEVTDLDEFRNTVLDAFKIICVTPRWNYIDKLESLLKIEPFGSHLNINSESKQTKESIRSGFVSMLDQLLGESKISASFEEKGEHLKDKLISIQRKVFPIHLLGENKVTSFNFTSQGVWDEFEIYYDHAQKTTEITKRLAPIFQALLELDYVRKATLNIDCPICNIKDSLTPVRIGEIKHVISDSKKYIDSRNNAEKIKNDLIVILETLNNDLDKTLPSFSKMKSKSRKSAGFGILKIKEILPESSQIIHEWIKSYVAFIRSMNKLKHIIISAKYSVDKLITDSVNQEVITHAKTMCEKLIEYFKIYLIKEECYFKKASQLAIEIKKVVNEQTRTQGWNEFIDILQSEENLIGEFKEKINYKLKIKGIEKTIKKIDNAIENVLNEKFSDLSEEIKYWWNALRPEEPTFFEAVKLRPNAKRTIDFKAGLYPTSTITKDFVVRDVVAVFSQSQMSCLGLAAFLARSVKNGAGFIILDDPILSVDDDHRAHFTHDVLEKLIESGIQIIVLTQDQSTWNAIDNLYSHLDVATFQVVLESLTEGSQIINTGDSLFSQLIRIKPYTRNKNPNMRKDGAKKTRDAAERFCKELLVKEKRSVGERIDITSYNGKTLEELSDTCLQYLKDPAHPGKLKQIRKVLNPGNHDDTIPSQGELTVAFGDLSMLAKFYLKE